MCVKLLKKTKRNYFSNLNTKRAVDNKKFWKTVKSSFSDKSNNFEIITLVENDSIASDDNKVANIFNEYFNNLLEDLNLNVPENLVNHYCKGEGPVSLTILKYQNHPSITSIKKNQSLNKFPFENVSVSDIKKKLQNLDTSKATQKSDLPTKIIEENFDILVPFLFCSVNSSIDLSNFQKKPKLADIIPACKKNSRNGKTNYHPVSILPNLSNVFQNILYKQIAQFFNKIFSKYQTGFRKGFNTQTCLVVMLKKFRKWLDDGGEYTASLTHLSKAFECLPHDLLIAKLHAYGFDTPSLNLYIVI